MPANLNAEHERRLLFLSEQSPQVIQDFCKLAVDYLQKGPNAKLYGAAAQKLRVEPETIERAVEALINLLLESRKREWSDEIFSASVRSLGFKEDGEKSLLRLYETEKSRTDRALSRLSRFLPLYRDVEWRFQAELASRSSLRSCTPRFTIDLVLDDGRGSEDERHVLLQCDASNLARLAQELESAVAEGRTRHASNLRRNAE